MSTVGGRCRLVLLATVAAISGGLLHAETIEQVMARYKLKPLLYVDASVAESMELDGNGGVTAWRDLSNASRDLTSSTTTKGSRRRYSGGRYPNTWVYDMGATGSGIDMKLPSDLSIASFIAVMDIDLNANAFFFGYTGRDVYQFHRGNNGEYSHASHPSAAWINASGWENGTEITGMTTSKPATGDLSLYTFNLKNGKATFNCLSQDRGSPARVGGRKLALLLCFDRTLSDDERPALEAAIREKLTNPKPEVKVTRSGFQQDGTYALALGLAQSGYGAASADIYLSVGESADALGEEVQVGTSVARDASVAYAVPGLNRNRAAYYRVRAVNDQGVESVAFGRLTDPVEVTLAELGLVPQTHFDAANEFSFETNAAGQVILWRGVENPTMDFARWYSTTPEDKTSLGRRRNYLDKWPVYDMGDVGSGIDLFRVKALTSKSVVMAVDIKPSAGAFFLGYTGSETYHFHRGNNGEYAGGPALASWKNASGWENGTEIGGMSASIPKSGELSVYLFNLTDTGASWNRLSQDRGSSGRNGGRQLGELMTFNRTLEPAERLALQTALMKKWRSQEAVTATWTGAAGTTDFANAGNWCCSNDLGEVSGVVPSDLTAVTFPGDKVVDIPANATLTCKTLSIAGPLTRDCDWSGATAELAGTIDLGGRALHLATVNGKPNFFDTESTVIRLATCSTTADDTTGAVRMSGTFSIMKLGGGTGTLVLDDLTTASALAVLGLSDVVDSRYDAADGESFVLGDADGVATWRNVSSFFDRDLTSSTTAKATRHLYQGRWVCDFGETGSNIDMNRRANATCRSVMAAMDIASDADAFFFGHSTDYSFHRGDNGEFASCRNAAAGWRGAAGWENGVSVSMTEDVPHEGSLSVYTFNLTESLAWNCVSQDRFTTRRNGGRKIGEMIFFSRMLTEDERAVLERVMTAKWRPSAPTTATWTGNGGDDDLTNAANWACANDAGPLPGVLPTETTSVTVPDGWSLDIPEGTSFVCKDLTLAGSLTRDCDWRGLTGALRGFLNLKGHKLQLSQLKGTATILSAQTAYRHYRFEILEIGGGNALQISELKFYNGLTDVTASKPSLASSGSATAYYENAFDGSVDTKWSAAGFDANNPPTVKVSFASPVPVTHYSWYTAGDTATNPSRNLRGWRLSGSDDGETWVTLDECRTVSGLLTVNKTRAFTGFVCAPDETAGEVDFAVPAGEQKVNTTVSFGGALKLVKGGDGSFSARKLFQGYAGGTYVEAGALVMGGSGMSLPFGSRGSLIRLASDATFDINAQTDERNYRLVMAGGTLTNTGGDVPSSSGCIGTVVLEDDAAFDVKYSFPLCDVVDLNGHALDVDIASGKALYLNVNGLFTNGTVNVSNGGWFCLDTLTGALRDMRTVDFTLNAAINLRTSINVRNLTMAYDSAYVDGNGTLNVYGVFTPSAHNYVNNFVLQDGATLNLANREGAYAIDESVTGKALTFADNATVGIDLGNRKVKTSERVVAWTEGAGPENLETLKFVTVSGRLGTFMKGVDGIYLQRGITIIIR